MELTQSLRKFWSVLSLGLAGLMLSLLLMACGGTDAAVTSRSLTTATAEATTSVASASGAITSSLGTTAATSTTLVAPSGQATTPAAVTSVPPQKVAQPGAPTGQTVSDVAESSSVVDVVKRLNPAVVTVYNRSKYAPGTGTTNRRTAPTPTASADSTTGGYVVRGIGSGVIISEDGYIITNNHVVDGQDDLTVALNDGKASVPAKLIGRDKLGDIAVLKIETKVPAVAKWADRVDVGETVVAIGSALGNFRNSVSKGVVSGLNRTLTGDSGTSVYVQTDAAINHGNSGGPLLNLRGEIVGINTAVLRSTQSSNQLGSADVAEGLGFAIPASIAKLLSDQIISKGSVVRPYFGITYQMITPAEAGTLSSSGTTIPAVEGAWVGKSANNQSGVVKGGPADKAGLKDNDVITAIDGVALNDQNPLVNVILKYKPNDKIKLTVQRDTQTLTVELTLGERPNDL